MTRLQIAIATHEALLRSSKRESFAVERLIVSTRIDIARRLQVEPQWVEQFYERKVS